MIAFHNGSIIADFLLGFTRHQNVTHLSSFLNQKLVNKQLFGGTILSITFNLTELNTNSNHTNLTGNNNESHGSEKLIMNKKNQTNDEQQQTTQASYTTITYKTLDAGLSITISETITITNNNFDKLPINNKNYELILVPTTDNTKNIVVRSTDTTEKTLLSSPVVETTNVVMKSPSNSHLLRPIKSVNEDNFTYIDESSDDTKINPRNGTI